MEPSHAHRLEICRGGAVQFEGGDALDIGEGAFIDRAVAIDLQGIRLVRTSSRKGVGGNKVGRIDHEEISTVGIGGPVQIERIVVASRVKQCVRTGTAEDTGQSRRARGGAERHGAGTRQRKNAETGGIREVGIPDSRFGRDDERIDTIAPRKGIGCQHLVGKNRYHVIASTRSKQSMS